MQNWVWSCKDKDCGWTGDKPKEIKVKETKEFRCPKCDKAKLDVKFEG